MLGIRPGGCSLAVDANRRFDLTTALEYARALAANAYLTRNAKDFTGLQLADELRKAGQSARAKSVFWTSAGSGMTFSAGEGLDVETTSLAATALMKDGRWPETVNRPIQCEESGVLSQAFEFNAGLDGKRSRERALQRPHSQRRFQQPRERAKTPAPAGATSV